ncbi:MAG TPA: hypothetical protein DD670_14260 [Planctomycetaceae bacterium]|nr:hypothetical protein [Planctomycetaceae bacterium]
MLMAVTATRFPGFGSLRYMVVVSVLASMTACSNRPETVSRRPDEDAAYRENAVVMESVEFYEKKLLDKDFRWNGPCSREDRIPVLHAARALAYIGDPAVPALFRASRNETIHFASVFDALQEIGLPTYKYLDEAHRKDTAALEKWWAENRDKTREERSKWRVEIGLPPVARRNSDSGHP